MGIVEIEVHTYSYVVYVQSLRTSTSTIILVWLDGWLIIKGACGNSGVGGAHAAHASTSTSILVWILRVVLLLVRGIAHRIAYTTLFFTIVFLNEV